MRVIVFATTLLNILTCLSARASTSSGLESVRSVQSNGVSNTAIGGGDCKAPICLPKGTIDDDVTMGGKYPLCESVSSVIGLGNKSNDGECAKETDKAKVQKLHGCLDQLRKSMPSDYQAQKAYISKLPSARLKSFLGMVLTSYGEAGGNFKVQDHLAIMKVLDNRTRTCVNGDKPNATTWDIATSPSQFSMYNQNIYSKTKDKHIKNTEGDKNRMNLALEAFSKLQCTKMAPPEKWEKAEHYKAKYVNPTWAKSSDLISRPAADGKSLAEGKTEHQFYTLPWSCVIRNETAPGIRASIDHPRSSLVATVFDAMSERAHATDLTDWEISKFPQRGSFLKLKAHPLIQIKVLSDPLGAKLVSAKAHPVHKFIDVIEYDAGEIGTSQIVRVHRAVLFSNRTQKILGDFPVSYAVEGLKTQPDQPQWSATDKEIRIADPESGETNVIEIDRP